MATTRLRRMRPIHLRGFTSALLLASVALGGCASLRGSAAPVVSTASRTSLVAAYPEDQALTAFYAPSDAARGGLDRRSYRDLVAGLYIAAADARYTAFRAELEREYRGSNAGTALDGLLMNGIAAVSGAHAARALAAGSAVVSGANGVLDKELFSGLTLQAVLAAMDANRTAVKIQLRQALSAHDADAYSLADAFDDIRELEAQASLDASLQQLSTLAGDRAQAAHAQLHALFTAPVREAPVQAEAAAFVRYVDGLSSSGQPADAQTLHALAAALGAPDDPSAATARKNIVLWVDQHVQTSSDLAALVAAAAPVTHKETY